MQFSTQQSVLIGVGMLVVIFLAFWGFKAITEQSYDPVTAGEDTPLPGYPDYVEPPRP